MTATHQAMCGAHLWAGTGSPLLLPSRVPMVKFPLDYWVRSAL